MASERKRDAAAVRREWLDIPDPLEARTLGLTSTAPSRAGMDVQPSPTPPTEAPAASGTRGVGPLAATVLAFFGSDKDS